MKTTFNTAIKAGIFAVALASAGASQAAGYSMMSQSDVLAEYGAPFDEGAVSFLSSGLSISIPTAVASSSGLPSVLVFCIDPLTAMSSSTGYAAVSYAASTDVRKLFESSYSLVGSATSINASSAASFQLALWEITNDGGLAGGNLYSGNQRFTAGGVGDSYTDEVVSGAATMLTNATNYHMAATSVYNYTQFTHADSQTMLGVSAVPEADTWAMLAAGLGLLGLVSRRKNTKNEKFA